MKRTCVHQKFSEKKKEKSILWLNTFRYFPPIYSARWERIIHFLCCEVRSLDCKAHRISTRSIACESNFSGNKGWLILQESEIAFR